MMTPTPDTMWHVSWTHPAWTPTPHGHQRRMHVWTQTERGATRRAEREHRNGAQDIRIAQYTLATETNYHP